MKTVADHYAEINAGSQPITPQEMAWMMQANTDLLGALRAAYAKGCADTRAMWAPDGRCVDSNSE